MDAMTIIWLFFALITKHFICDFPLQWKYQWANKGTYGHPGGILHAGICSVGTFIALSCVLGVDTFVTLLLIVISFLEGVFHYHVDWAKMNLNKYWKLGPTTSEQFWWLLGFDQWVHYATYVVIVAYFAEYGV